MSLLALFAVAIGLTFDTFAVSVSTGLVVNNIRFWQATRIAIVFALFQAFMPLMGWLIGSQVDEMVREYDHWLAFGLLSLIGGKMIYESFQDEEGKKELNPFNPVVLIGMAIATSIDAFIVGITFAFMKVDITLSMWIILCTTFIVAMLGMLFGKKAGRLFGRRMEIFGGLILIIIGFSILYQDIWL